MTTLSVFYTQNLAGKLELLPRMATFINKLRAHANTERVLLLDVGGTCAPDVPECAQSEGRAPLILLDAMTYQAAYVGTTLSPAAREKLRESYIGMALVDEATPFVQEGVAFAAEPPPAHPHRLHISSLTASQFALVPAPDFFGVYTLQLQTLSAGQVGQTTLALGDEPRLISAQVHALPSNTPPAPTIAGTLEFVRDELRYYLKVRQRKGGFCNG